VAVERGGDGTGLMRAMARGDRRHRRTGRWINAGSDVGTHRSRLGFKVLGEFITCDLEEVRWE
jgi:hypothetical protein